MNTPGQHIPGIFAGLNALIDAAPDLPEADAEATVTAPTAIPFVADTIAEKTGVPSRYRAGWPRPTDDEWNRTFRRVTSCVKSGGIIGLIGTRGTGKTRLACEVMRDEARIYGRYTTAMGLFLRIRSGYGKKGGESEADIVREFANAPMLILDELQERGGSEWEDRLLTHILDARYGDMKPTILVANLTRQALAQQIGDSINSRLIETGGILELTGPSHRSKP